MRYSGTCSVCNADMEATIPDSFTKRMDAKGRRTVEMRHIYGPDAKCKETLTSLIENDTNDQRRK